MWIKALILPGAHHFLQDHCHLLGLPASGDGAAVVSGSLEVGRCIHKFDRFDQFAEAFVGVRLVVGHHLGTVNAGERMLEGVFEKAGRPYGQGQPGPLAQRPQIADEFHREVGVQEGVDEGNHDPDTGREHAVRYPAEDLLGSTQTLGLAADLAVTNPGQPVS
jgi:hypothetical protein